MSKKKIFIILAVFLLVAISAPFLLKKIKTFQEKKVAWRRLEQRIKLLQHSFGQESAIVIKELSTGTKIAFNADKLFPAASLTKIPIMASYFYASAQKKIDLKKNLILENKFKALGSGILKNFPPGTSMSIEKLIDLMIAESDNTACNMLIDYIGFDYLNSSFKQLGLKRTNIIRKMMDFTSRKNGDENYTTASDMAFLLEEIYRGKLINKNYSQKALSLLKKQKIRDRLPAKLPPETLVAHKTGLERGTCHDVGIIYTSGGNFLVCALTKHRYKTAHPAKRFIARIALAVYNYALSPQGN